MGIARSPVRILVACLVSCLGAGAAPAIAATITSFTLSTNAALWHDQVEARIAGIGCSGEADGPYVTQVAGASSNWVVDIDLLGCHDASNDSRSFSTVVTLPRLLPHGYEVYVQDAIRHIVSPPPPPLAMLPLSVHTVADLTLEVPEAATAGQPVTIALSGLAGSSCFYLDPPSVEQVPGVGGIITLDFYDECPFLPPPGPNVFRRELEVGPLAAGRYEIHAFDLTPVFLEEQALPALARQSLTVFASGGCVPSATTLCLAGRRFAVEVAWQDFAHRTGAGQALPLAGDGSSGLFWFFEPDNVELTVKLLDGCGLTASYWVFLSSGSTVEYTVTVTDTATGRHETYHNTSGEAAPLRTDVASFGCGQ